MLCAKLENGGYLIPHLVRRVKYEKPCDWYLSGVGSNDGLEGWQALVPTESDYDIRRPDPEYSENDCDCALAYTKVGLPSNLFVHMAGTPNISDIN